MDELFNGTVAAAGAKPSKVQDLSSDIEQSVAREPMDRVRCVRVFDDFYRCNWWSPMTDPGAPMAEWARLAMHRVRQSRFIQARQVGGQLVMDEVGDDAIAAAARR